MNENIAAAPDLDVLTCSFEVLLAIAQQMPPERFEQLKAARPGFADWLEKIRT